MWKIDYILNRFFLLTHRTITSSDSDLKFGLYPSNELFKQSVLHMQRKFCSLYFRIWICAEKHIKSSWSYESQYSIMKLKVKLFFAFQTFCRIWGSGVCGTNIPETKEGKVTLKLKQNQGPLFGLRPDPLGQQDIT